MATSTKAEFAVEMTCNNCVQAIKKALEGNDGISSVSISLEKGQVLVDTTLSTYQVQDLIESTGKRAALMGLGPTADICDRQPGDRTILVIAGKGHLGAAVAMMSGPPGIEGVARFVQVSQNLCVIDATVDGLKPTQYGVYIHELGDISQGCDSCGDVFEFGSADLNQRYGDICSITSNEQGRGEFRVESARIKVWDIIGRSMVLHEETNGPNTGIRVACGIVARSAGLFQNTKRICACDGVVVWDERDVPIAGPGRRKDAQLHAAQL